MWKDERTQGRFTVCDRPLSPVVCIDGGSVILVDVVFRGKPVDKGQGAHDVTSASMTRFSQRPVNAMDIDRDDD